jgi:ferredoxin-NADP reductase
MTESGLHFNKKLIHGARTSGEFWFSGLFFNKMEENYLRFATRENAPVPGIYNGRITAWLNHQKNLPKNIKYYLCGNAIMVVEVRDILLSKGIAYDNIVSEIYF